MTDKEILAELKKCYEYLDDIKYNGDQLTTVELHELAMAQNKLLDTYSNLWERTEEDITIKDEDDLTIGKYVYVDYYDVGNDDYISKSDILKNGKEYEWWNDYEFLLK